MNSIGKKYLIPVMTLVLSLTLGLTLGLTSSYSYATENTETFKGSGTISGFNRKRNELGIGDGTYLVDNFAVITDSKGVRTTSFSLTNGTKIEFEYENVYNPAYKRKVQTIKKIRLR